MLDGMSPEAIRKPRQSKGGRPSTVSFEAEMGKASEMSVRRAGGIDLAQRDSDVRASHYLKACRLSLQQHRTLPPRLTSFANKALTRS